jgi:hypothetical protein
MKAYRVAMLRVCFQLVWEKPDKCRIKREEYQPNDPNTIDVLGSFENYRIGRGP